METTNLLSCFKVCHIVARFMVYNMKTRFLFYKNKKSLIFYSIHNINVCFLKFILFLLLVSKATWDWCEQWRGVLSRAQLALFHPSNFLQLSIFSWHHPPTSLRNKNIYCHSSLNFILNNNFRRRLWTVLRRRSIRKVYDN